MRQRMGLYLPYRLLFLVTRRLAVAGPDSAGQLTVDREQPLEMWQQQRGKTVERSVQAAMRHRRGSQASSGPCWHQARRGSRARSGT
jgi:hypothetical protein